MLCNLLPGVSIRFHPRGGMQRDPHKSVKRNMENINNQELKSLYEQDIEERSRIDWDTATPDQISELRKKDNARRMQVLTLVNKKKIKSAKDYHHAALIFQHGDTTDDYKLAHEFAKKALELGDESVRWLYAATLDRYLISTGQPQKY